MLTSGGTTVLVGAGLGSGVSVLTHIGSAWIRSRLLKQRVVFFVAKDRKEDLLALKEMIESGKVTPLVDRVYPLTETAAALRYLEEGRARGKVVITI
jgi:NADPH:quinone reductase-like Zn-dependent oxidoreductase